MSDFEISIDGRRQTVAPGQTILQAARALGINIPTLCHLEKCGPLTTCQVCLVKWVDNGQSRLVPSCGTKVTPGMVIESETEEVHEARRTALELLFSDHVGDCLSPCHRLCPLQLNIPVMLREIKSDQLDKAAATMRQALPLAGVLGRLCHHPCEQGCRRGDFDEPAAIRDMELYLTEREMKQEAAPAPRSPRGKHSVVIVGGGPAGLSAAWELARKGHAVTVMDRNDRMGGTLRHVPEKDLPPGVMEAELAALAKMGIEFKSGIELGNHVTLAGLRCGFDAILIAVGDVTQADGARMGVPVTGSLVKTDPSSCVSMPPNIFAAGACVKMAKQLVRAMAEGRSAAQCVHQYLTGAAPLRPEKPFSSVMGRLESGELREFLTTASPSHRVAPCANCASVNAAQAREESARCLHCDCQSSGNCLLQHYAQSYGADANRFKSSRKPFTRQLRRGGILFEPGKCILCGICVRLVELAGEMPGLAFVGRGFNVRVATPFDLPFEQGLGEAAAECVRHCPTGALSFAEAAND